MAELDIFEVADYQGIVDGEVLNVSLVFRNCMVDLAGKNALYTGIMCPGQIAYRLHELLEEKRLIVDDLFVRLAVSGEIFRYGSVYGIRHLMVQSFRELKSENGLRYNGPNLSGFARSVACQRPKPLGAAARGHLRLVSGGSSPP
jgi:hypothetical protein